MSFDFYLFVFGGGSGVVRAARVAAGMDYKVCIAEADRMGGTCVIRGCVPKKLMVYASKHKESFNDARQYGWNSNVESFDWQHFKKKLDDELDRLENIYNSLLKGNFWQNVTLVFQLFPSDLNIANIIIMNFFI